MWEEASEISKEFYLSCIVDRESAKIAFISSTEGGVDIEKVATERPDKISTTKIDLKSEGPNDDEIKNIVSIFNLTTSQKKEASNLVKVLYKVLVEKDASLIEVNPLIITKSEKILCLDAKMTFDDNAVFEETRDFRIKRFKRGGVTLRLKQVNTT